MKPPVPYFGGKQRIADRIVGILPPHDHYVEPFAGGLSVLLAKPPSKIETVNDLDGHLVTFWRVLRDRPDELTRACSLTPHSRAELSISREPMDDLDDLEVARRVWVQLTQGRAGRRTRTGWRFYIDPGTSTPLAGYLSAYVGRMPAAAARLADVQFECRHALDVIADYGRNPANLLYVDPPYMGEVRGSIQGRGFSRQYVHEFDTADQHRQLAEVVCACRARVVLSGYASDLYAEMYAGWHATTIAAYTQGKGSGSRTEVLWTNYQPPVDHLFAEGAS